MLVTMIICKIPFANKLFEATYVFVLTWETQLAFCQSDGQFFHFEFDGYKQA